jgi:hypothetical protein
VTETYDLKKGFGVAMLLWLLLRLTKKEVTKEYKKIRRKRPSIEILDKH